MRFGHVVGQLQSLAMSERLVSWSRQLVDDGIVWDSGGFEPVDHGISVEGVPGGFVECQAHQIFRDAEARLLE